MVLAVAAGAMLTLVVLGVWRAGSAPGPPQHQKAAPQGASAPGQPPPPALEPDTTVPPPPTPAAPPLQVPSLSPPGVTAAGPASSEALLMTRLRKIKEKDPAAAVALAREGNRRFPNSTAAPERASILVRALAAQGQISQARGEAEAMVNLYPDSEWVRDVERFSGAHRRRNIRVTDAGLVEYE